MKWRRKQQEKEKPPSPVPWTFSLSHVLPLSWISKLKRLGTKTKTHPGNTARTTRPEPGDSRGRSKSGYFSFTPDVLDRIAARFPPGIPRRLSVGEDDTLLARERARHGTRLARSARHNSVGELEFRPFRSEFDPAELWTSRWRLPRDLLNVSSESGGSANVPMPVRRRRRRRRRRRTEDDRSSISGITEGDTFPRVPPPPHPIHTSRAESMIHAGRTGGIRRRSEAAEARRSTSGRFRQRSRPRVKVCSPRPRKPVGRRTAAEGRDLERFAVVKCSCDPQKDFRESMVEMIWEKGIGRPEEMERLLACYLSLNSDEHHDVIVKVFRQVWFELNQGRCGSVRNVVPVVGSIRVKPCDDGSHRPSGLGKFSHI